MNVAAFKRIGSCTMDTLEQAANIGGANVQVRLTNDYGQHRHPHTETERETRKHPLALISNRTAIVVDSADLPYFSSCESMSNTNVSFRGKRGREKMEEYIY